VLQRVLYQRKGSGTSSSNIKLEEDEDRLTEVVDAKTSVVVEPTRLLRGFLVAVTWPRGICRRGRECLSAVKAV
jgi:hypothetical protein